MSNFNNFGNQPHRFKLEKGSKKHHCPECGKKRFVRFIDTTTGEYLPEQYGRCDKGDGHYFVNPYSDGYAKVIWEQEKKVTGVTKVTVPKQKYFSTQPKPQPQPEPVFFENDTLKQTLQPERYEKNKFIQNLFYRVQFPFEVDEVTTVIQLYRLGTVANGYRAGAITFPFIDIKQNVRAIQVKQFDEQNHTIGTDFLHSIIEKHHTRNNKPLPEWLESYIKQEKRVSCLFGEHILSKYPNAIVYLFEAPKTAVYSTLYFGHPETSNIICLAVYNKSSFSFDKLKILQGRFVYVFPDLSKEGSTFKEWETKAKEYEKRLTHTRFIFSDLLEQLAPERDKSEGNDLADYLIKQDWRLFRKRNIQELQPQTEPEKVTKVTLVTPQQNIIFSDAEQLPKVEILKTEHPKNLSNNILDLEQYFAEIQLPTKPIQFDKCGTINDLRQFIDSHLAIVKAHIGKGIAEPYLNRLMNLKNMLEYKNKAN